MRPLYDIPPTHICIVYDEKFSSSHCVSSMPRHWLNSCLLYQESPVIGGFNLKLPFHLAAPPAAELGKYSLGNIPNIQDIACLTKVSELKPPSNSELGLSDKTCRLPELRWDA
jgi:hypothetical protein